MKKLLHKSLSFILVLTLVLSLFSGLSFNSSAADLPSSGSCGTNVTYTFNSSTGLLTIGGSGAMNYYSSSNSPFYNQNGIKSIIINSGVTSIGIYAFRGCNSLTSITIPDSVTSIGISAFCDCSSLTSVTIPNSVTSIGFKAFCGCSNLKSITIPDSVTSIGSSTFRDCSGLTSITIPNSVTSIGDSAFYGCSGLTSVSIPDSVTSIDSFAFYGCSGLKKVNISSIEAWCRIRFGGSYSNPLYYAHNLYLNDKLVTDIIIPDFVTSIGSYAFENCSSLTSITIPNSVASIEYSAFRGCIGLTGITIPNSVTSIGIYAFYGCSNLTSITIPNSVTSIGGGAFCCSGLTSVIIPDSVTSIGDDSFYRCSGLTSITIPNSVTSIGDQAFYDCSGLKKVNISSIEAWCKIRFGDRYSNPLCYAHNLYLNDKLVTDIVIPNSVTSIGWDAFSGCSGLTSVTIPSSVTSIGNYTFSDCSGLTGITIPNSVTSIEEGAFSGCSRLTNITIPDSVTSIEHSAFYGCSGLKELTMPCSAKIYNSGLTFENCTNIEKITLTKGTGAMQNYDYSTGNTYYLYTPWFISKSNLKELVIEDGVTSIGSYAFYGCSGLTSVIIPDSVTSIGDSAFYNCSGLTGVTIPNSVTSIGSGAFYGCGGLTSIEVDKNNKVYDSRDNCNAIIKTSTNTLVAGCKNTVISNSVTSIGSGAFYGCSGLTSVTIPNSVTSIEYSAFRGCIGLTGITIPNSVTSISEYAFESCRSLTSITIPNSVTSIGDHAFSICSGLKSINIPNSVSSIGSYAFYGCSNLTSITIPNSVTSIGSYAFYGCSSLTGITIPNFVTSIGYYAFYNCSGLTSVTIPNSVTSIGSYAFYGCSWLKELTMPCSAKIFNSADTFLGCTNLEKLTLTKGTGAMQDFGTSFAEDAAETYYQYTPWFLSREKLKEIVLEDGVEHIGNYAFYAQSNISRVIIPTSVTSIGEHAFGLCSALKDVYYPGSEAQWNQMTIAADNDALLGATIHFNHIHQFENPVVTATCTEGGKRTAYCACGKMQEETVPALGHAFEEWKLTKAPTCTAEGIETRVCARDASHKETRTVDALGHHFEADKQYCLNGCGKRNPDYVPPHVHAYKAVVVAPKATALGYTQYKCACGVWKKNAAGKVIKDTFTAPIGKLALKHSARTANAIKVQWNTVKTAIGYQVQISSKDGKKWSTYATLKAGITSYTFKKLAAGNNYKFRVRFYIKADDGKNYYSPWSATLNSPTLPVGTTLTKLTPAKRAFVAQWKKQAVNGYQVQYSLKANFAGAKTITVKNPKSLKATAAKLYAGKYYFVRIRTYKTITKANYFSAWSKTYKVKTK